MSGPATGAASRPSSGTCLLMAHRVMETPSRDHDVSWARLEALLAGLMTAAAELTTETEPDRGARVALTFDDGTADHLAVGEHLAERGLGAIFFISAGLVGVPGYLAERDVRRLAELGHRLGSHGLTHRRLDQLEADALDRELVESRRRLEAMSGRAVDLYATVGGISVPGLPARLERAGYVGARSTRWGIYRRAEERWRMPCLPVTELTARRGWLEEAVGTMRLPPRLALLRAAKDVLPDDLRARLRHALTR